MTCCLINKLSKGLCTQNMQKYWKMFCQFVLPHNVIFLVTLSSFNRCDWLMSQKSPVTFVHVINNRRYICEKHVLIYIHYCYPYPQNFNIVLNCKNHDYCLKWFYKYTLLRLVYIGTYFTWIISIEVSHEIDYMWKTALFLHNYGVNIHSLGLYGWLVNFW